MISGLRKSIFFLHLWIVDGHDGAFLQENVASAIAGVSRSSLVSFLKANHKTAIFLVTVLKKGNDFPAKVCLRCTSIDTMLQTRLKMSFESATGPSTWQVPTPCDVSITPFGTRQEAMGVRSAYMRDTNNVQ